MEKHKSTQKLPFDRNKLYTPEPIAEKVKVVHSIHGNDLIDEYSWLRDKDWPHVKDEKILSYIKEENDYYDRFFSNFANEQENLFLELKSRIKLSDQSPYVKIDDYYYYTRVEESTEYTIYCRKYLSCEAAEEIILDVNEIAKGKKFTQVAALSVSPDHNFLAYSVDFNGDEKYTIMVYDIKNDLYLNDQIEGVLGDIIWHEKIFGFFYTPVNDKWRTDKLFFHNIGQSKATDTLILSEEDDTYQISASKSSDDNYILIDISGHENNEIYFISMDDKNITPVELKKRTGKTLYCVDHHNHDNGYFYIHSNYNAKDFKITRIKDTEILSAIERYQDNGAQDMGYKILDNSITEEDCIPEEKGSYLVSFDITKNYLILNYKILGLTQIKIFKFDDRFAASKAKKVSFPEVAYSAGAFACNFAEDDIRISYSSLARPSTVYSYDFVQNELSIIKTQEIPSGFNPEEYIVERVFVQSSFDIYQAHYNTTRSEGERFHSSSTAVSVPVTLLYKKSLFKKDGSNPMYLYGYGSYGIAMPVGFRNMAISIANRGFVFAIAHIRGGDELGYDWYENAKFLNKKNSFYDFINCAKELSKQNYTKEKNIVIAGGSAGGMLVGQAMNEASDMFKCVVAHVPFVDVLNTMLDDTLPLTPGEFKEWGNPKELEYFEYIKSYSPYDNVKEQNYPAIFASAGLSDPRVGYWECAKWIAKTREKRLNKDQASDEYMPILFKTNMEFGHKGASGRFEYLKEVAQELVFIFFIFDVL